jgi:Spy/CpxP family protein refolding chaperone
MQKSRTLFLSGIGVAVVTAGLVLSSSLVRAQTTDKPFGGLAEAIAKKFNLDQTQVEAVFTEYHDQHRQEMMEKMKVAEDERLSRLVTDGKITEAQKQAIVDKLTELKAERQNFDKEQFENMTPEQRKAEMLKKKEELDAWAKEQGIDPSVLMPTMKFKTGRGGHGSRMFEEKIEPVLTPQS